eukprot:5075681-Pleurochrysis_carterae.AAC.1
MEEAASAKAVAPESAAGEDHVAMSAMKATRNALHPSDRCHALHWKMPRRFAEVETCVGEAGGVHGGGEHGGDAAIGPDSAATSRHASSERASEGEVGSTRSVPTYSVAA